MGGTHSHVLDGILENGKSNDDPVTCSGLYVGGSDVCDNEAFFRENGITHVISLGPDTPASKSQFKRISRVFHTEGKERAHRHREPDPSKYRRRAGC